MGEPGCCYSDDSYKANGKCARATDRARCEDMGCSFLVTDDVTDCEFTTTESPTTTQIPGCCKGTSRTSNDACNDIEDADQCDRRSSCTFIAFGILEEDCQFPVTSPPEDPGCCYGNPDIAYSKRWMESCKTFGFESECLMLTNEDGEPRCTFEPLGEYEDCETVWPTTTTTTEAPGCCYGSSYKAQAKCLGLDRAMCERKGCEFLETENEDDCILTTTETPTSQSKCESMGCSFLVTDDYSDYEMTTTSTPTTTTEVGCCYGEGVKENEMCGNKVGRAQCERNDACEFRSGADADCSYTETTDTIEPGCCYGDTAKTNEMCAEKETRDQCERSGKCEFRSGIDADCELPTTTSEPWLGAK